MHIRKMHSHSCYYQNETMNFCFQNIFIRGSQTDYNKYMILVEYMHLNITLTKMVHRTNAIQCTSFEDFFFFKRKRLRLKNKKENIAGLFFLYNHFCTFL